ncbi:Ral GTPase-activating protein subunit alpha-1 [Lamellibrachia satsuma]|nr:Ral GTPase-activating protein subunit alpha-1 [Lamellibrachia satsuma]
MGFLVSDTYDAHEAKTFFDKNYSLIYYIFHDVFTSVETDLRQRVTKSHKEELDTVLFIFEKILTLLPELIHRRWQYHSIGHLMKKLLHTGNSLKLRREGMRLFLIWYQILMDNATEECDKTYANLVPPIDVDDKADHDMFVVQSTTDGSIGAVGSGVSPMEIVPVLPPQSGEKQPECPTKWLLELLLTFMVSEVTKVEWLNREMQIASFEFLFNKFKQFYLLSIFPSFQRENSIYGSHLVVPTNRTLDLVLGSERPQVTAMCQEVLVRWMATFTHKAKRMEQTSQVVHAEKLSEDHPSEHTNKASSPHDGAPPVGSNNSTLSTVSVCTEKDSTGSSVGSEDHTISEYEIVRQVLYSCRENIVIVLEIFRQAFLFPFHQAAAIRRVISVYKHWLQEDCHPIFMQEAGEQHQVVSGELAANGCPQRSNGSDTQPLLSQANDQFDDPQCTSARWSEADGPLEAGLQKVLQVFITNSANLFLLEQSENMPVLEEQVDICKRVLNIYRFMVMNQELHQRTWEQLLTVLLRITSGVLSVKVPTQRQRTLSGKLAQPIFQTLIVTWIRANLNVYVSAELWDQFLEVLSSLTAWVELIREWAKTMDTLTGVLARHVYNLDLNDLPLDRLSEQKTKRGRGGKPKNNHSSATRTFSRGWSRHDQVESLRSQLKGQVTASGLTTAQHGNKGLVLPKTAGDATSGLMMKEGAPRVRSRSGDTSPTDNQLGLPPAAPLVRSNSDSSIMMLDFDRKGSRSTGSLKDETDDGSDKEEESSLVNEVLSSMVASMEAEDDVDSLNASFVSAMSGPFMSKDSSAETRDPLSESQTSMYMNASSEFCVDDRRNSEGGDMTAANESGQSSNSGGKRETLLNLTFALGDDGDPGSVGTSHTSAVTDNLSMTSIDSNQVSYQLLDQSIDNISFDKGSYGDRSDIEVPLMITESTDLSETGSGQKGESPVAVSRTQSNQPVVNSMEEVIDGGGRYTAEMHRTESFKDSASHREGVDDYLAVSKRCVLACGTLTGWAPDVAVGLWRRMLGGLGNINKIKDPEIHAQVIEYLGDLADTLLKIRANLSVSRDNQSSPPPPELVPPAMFYTPWLFEAVQLPYMYKQGRLLAYRLLCVLTVRPIDLAPSPDYLSRFYHVLHHGLVNSDQESTNELVRHCGPRFFSLPLPGATMLMLDFIHAANTITATGDLKHAPRVEAMSILGSLLCFPNHLGELPALQPKSGHLTIMLCGDVKEHIINVLLKSGKKEPDGLARCIAISSLGIFMYEELSHDIMHPKLKEAVNTLLSTLKFNNKSVAQVAAHMLLLLCDHIPIFLEKDAEIPCKIIETICNTISALLPSTNHSNSPEDKRLLVSIMFCLLEWCMRVPLEPFLLDTAAGAHKSLLYKTFKVLDYVVTGPLGTLTPRSSFPDYTSTDSEIENVRETSHSIPSTPKSPVDTAAEYTKPSVPTATAAQRLAREGNKSRGIENDMLKLAARTVMTKLVNHLGHFPMGGGAAQLNSSVLESDDSDTLDGTELIPDIFNAPNVQFFVLKNMTLISFVELPAQTNLPGGTMTARLTTGKTITRAIIRDLAGRFCWDSAVLYGPPRCRTGSYPAAPVESLEIVEDIDRVGRRASCDGAGDISSLQGTTRSPGELPLYQETKEPERADNLNEMLQYIGFTSPECHLHPGEALNAPFHALDDLPPTTEQCTMGAVLQEKDNEAAYLRLHQTDSSMTASSQHPVDNRESSSPFQLCRLYLNQLGFLQWGKRPHFDLLKKTDKLLRELKHLDNQKCRETHKVAVIYVAAGQEDKQSILMNTGGSKAYEDFVAGLGWEVSLESHTGFMGGLQHNGTTGLTAPYYATATVEVIYHVSTRMPADCPGGSNVKLRHLGNDEVQIIWSDHTRSYRRGIIPTEFGDVLIIIYPLHNGLFRIEINRIPGVPFFGPLFDGAIVDDSILPGLVRATALNASQILRSLKPFYKPFFEERAKCVENIVENHKERSTFEEFSAHVFAPVLPPQSVDLPESPTTCGPPQPPGGSASIPATRDEVDKTRITDKPSSVKPTKAGELINSEVGISFNRRLSFGKTKKSVVKQTLAQQQMSSPPDSPSSSPKTKK